MWKAFVLLALAAWTLAPAPASAQWPEIPANEVVRVTFTSEDLNDIGTRYNRVFLYRAQPGQDFVVHFIEGRHTGGYVIANDSRMLCSGELLGRGPDTVAYCEIEGPESGASDIQVFVTVNEPGPVYLAIYPYANISGFVDAAASLDQGSSLVDGMTVGGTLYGTRSTIEGISQPHTSSGYSLRGAMGVADHVEVFAEIQDEIADEGLEGQEGGEGLYSVRGKVGGLRIYLSNRFSSFRPYVQGSYGLRERESVDGDILYLGTSFGGAIGGNIFLTRELSLDLGLVGTRTRYDRARVDDEDTPLDGLSFQVDRLRLSGGITVNVSALMGMFDE